MTISRTFMNKIILITLITLFCGCTAIKIQKENLTITEIENEKYLKLEFSTKEEIHHKDGNIQFRMYIKKINGDSFKIKNHIEFGRDKDSMDNPAPVKKHNRYYYSVYFYPGLFHNTSNQYPAPQDERIDLNKRQDYHLIFRVESFSKLWRKWKTSDLIITRNEIFKP